MLGARGLRIRGSIPDMARVFLLYKTLRLATGNHAATYEVAVAWSSSMTFIKC
jgi:hypothetical protein